MTLYLAQRGTKLNYQQCWNINPSTRHFVLACWVQSLSMNKELPQISHEVMQALINYSWPGNVRELQNCAEYALILSSKGLIQVENVPERILHNSVTQKNSLQYLEKNDGTFGPPSMLSIKKNKQTLEMNLICEALRRSKGIKTQAAKSLEISTKTLLYKLRDYNIDPDQFSQ